MLHATARLPAACPTCSRRGRVKRGNERAPPRILSCRARSIRGGAASLHSPALPRRERGAHGARSSLAFLVERVRNARAGDWNGLNAEDGAARRRGAMHGRFSRCDERRAARGADELEGGGTARTVRTCDELVDAV